MTEHTDLTSTLTYFCPTCHCIFRDPARQSCPECNSPKPDEGWGLLPYPFRNNFILMEQLGRGGMGAVYKAISNETGKAVALKIARMDRDVEEMKHRFSREMAVANMLGERDKDAFVGVTSTDTMAQPYYMAMEFVDAPTLTGFLLKNGKKVNSVYILPYMEAIKLGEAILASLSVAHHHKIVHMDIKPDNIFIQEMVSADGKVVYHAKIADLGACIFEDDESSKDNMILGTPGYMSPEQIMGKSIHRSTDVYAVAAIMYELITGKTPYEPEPGLRGMARAKGYLKNMKAGRLQQSDLIPSDVFALLQKALAYKHSDRFQEAGEFKDALVSLLETQVQRNRSQLQSIHEQYHDLKERIDNVRESLKDLLQVSTELLSLEKQLDAIPTDDQDIALEPQVIKNRLGQLATEARNLESRLDAVRKNLAAQNKGGVSKLGTKMAKGIKGLFKRDKEDEAEPVQGSPVLSRSTQKRASVNMSQITAVMHKEEASKNESLLKLAIKGPAKVVPPGTGRVLCVAFSPSGRYLVTGSNKGLIAVFDLQHGGKPEVFQAHEDSIRSIDFAPDGSLFVTASWDKVIKVWDIRTQKEVETMFGHTAGVWGAFFTSDGRYVVSAGSDESFRVWSFPGGRIVNQVRLTDKQVISMAISREEDFVWTGGWKGQVAKWAIPDMTVLEKVKGHNDAVRALGVSPGGRLLATGGADGTVHTWEAKQMTHIATLHGHTDWIRSIAVSREGQIIATGSNDRTLRLWRANGEFLGVVGRRMPANIPVAFSEDGNLLASGYEPDTAAIFSTSKFIR